jgi:hypothetical protein
LKIENSFYFIKELNYFTGLGGNLPSSASGWNGNVGHSRNNGPSNNGRHHNLPHQFGGSPASMMLNSYCTMPNSKSHTRLSFFYKWI